jgi:polysaccharide biosynthesis transport protein
LNTFKRLSHDAMPLQMEPWPPRNDMSGEAEAPAGMSLHQVWVILRAHWKVTLIIAAAVSVLSAVAIKFMAKTYTATSTLIVDQDKKDPLAVNMLADGTFSSYVATQMELLHSPVILLPVVDRMHLTEDRNFAGGYTGQDAKGLREYTAQNLNLAVQVDLARGGQLLYISASARDPGRAADIANTIADVYVFSEQRRMSGPAGERASRYADDLVELRAKVAAAQDKLTSFRQQKGITEVTSQSGEASDPESQALKSLEQQLLEAQNARRTLESRSSGAQASADEALASPIIQQLKTQMAAQQTQAAQLSATYGAKHPKVLEINSQLALTTRQLSNELHNLSDNVATQLARAKELEGKYAQAVAAQRTKVLTLRGQQGDGAKLQLELDSAQAVYKRALDGYDQIMFASSSNNTNVSLINRATPPTRASRPNKLKLMLAAMLVGLGLGVVAPFLYEILLNRRLRCRDDIERGLHIPVLAQFDAFAAPTGAA